MSDNFWYRVEDNGEAFYHVQAKNADEAFRNVTADLGYTEGVTVADLSQDMKSECVCSDGVHEFINLDFPKLPGRWQCTDCENEFICPPDEINWDNERMFHAGYQPCPICVGDGYRESCPYCNGSCWWKPGTESDHWPQWTKEKFSETPTDPYYDDDCAAEMDLGGEEE